MTYFYLLCSQMAYSVTRLQCDHFPFRGLIQFYAANLSLRTEQNRSSMTDNLWPWSPGLAVLLPWTLSQPKVPSLLTTCTLRQSAVAPTINLTRIDSVSLTLLLQFKPPSFLLERGGLTPLNLAKLTLSRHR